MPTIPEFMKASFDFQPTNMEIQAAAWALGPHKSAGLDGFNANIIQHQWASFGPVILSEVHKFFQTGIMPNYLAKSNLILIPKGTDSSQVGDYRPISVCNVLYKVISKILTMRLKPYVAGCISKTQSAFVPGREISENIILLREVLHSFKSKNYANKDFCLKVELSKAFDRMDWDYLQQILPLYGVPPKLVGWIMACVRSAEFTIVLNGEGGGGFFTSSCGLRKGCSLSPYLFIFGMDLLSRSLSSQVQSGDLKGVRMAPACDPITNVLYADDLLIFGKAEELEALNIMQTLEVFSRVSGQQIGLSKSSIWFSQVTDPITRNTIAEMLQVNLRAISPK